VVPDRRELSGPISTTDQFTPDTSLSVAQWVPGTEARDDNGGVSVGEVNVRDLAATLPPVSAIEKKSLRHSGLVVRDALRSVRVQDFRPVARAPHHEGKEIIIAEENTPLPSS